MRSLLLALVPALSGLQGCSSIRYQHDFDRSVEFGSYETYGYPEERPASPENSAPAADELILGRVRRALENILRSKGLEPADLPDLLVFVQTAVHDRVEVQSWGYGYSRRDVQVYNYKEGSLIVELWDRQAKKLVWYSSAEGVQDERDSPGELDRKVARVVERMFRDYPVP